MHLLFAVLERMNAIADCWLTQRPPNVQIAEWAFRGQTCHRVAAVECWCLPVIFELRDNVLVNGRVIPLPLCPARIVVLPAPLLCPRIPEKR